MRDWSDKQVVLWLPTCQEDYDKYKNLIAMEYDYEGYKDFVRKSKIACDKIGLRFEAVKMKAETVLLAMKDSGIEPTHEGYIQLMQSGFGDMELELQEAAAAANF